jgi:integrase
VRAAIKSFLDHLRRRGLSSDFVRCAQGSLDRMTDAKNEDFALRDITPAKARAMYERLVNQGYSAATHRGDLKRSRAWMKWCLTQGWLKGRNPFSDVEPAGRERKGKTQLRVDAARKFSAYCLSVASDEPGAVAALLALILGMRSGEILGLVGVDVDDGGRLLWVSGTKTESSRRHLEVPDVLQPHLIRLAETAGPEGRLFPMSRAWIGRQVQSLCMAADVPRVCPHALRGTHSTLAVKAGTSAHLAMAALSEISRSMGHDGTVITREHYVRREALDAATTGAVLRVIQGGNR